MFIDLVLSNSRSVNSFPNRISKYFMSIICYISPLADRNRSDRVLKLIWYCDYCPNFDIWGWVIFDIYIDENPENRRYQSTILIIFKSCANSTPVFYDFFKSRWLMILFCRQVQNNYSLKKKMSVQIPRLYLYYQVHESIVYKLPNTLCKETDYI